MKIKENSFERKLNKKRGKEKLLFFSVFLPAKGA